MSAAPADAKRGVVGECKIVVRLMKRRDHGSVGTSELEVLLPPVTRDP